MNRKKKDACPYCREDPKSILCPGGTVLRYSPRYRILIIMSRKFTSDQIRPRYCLMCGRRL